MPGRACSRAGSWRPGPRGGALTVSSSSPPAPCCGAGRRVAARVAHAVDLDRQADELAGAEALPVRVRAQRQGDAAGGLRGGPPIDLGARVAAVTSGADQLEVAVDAVRAGERVERGSSASRRRPSRRTGGGMRVGLWRSVDIDQSTSFSAQLCTNLPDVDAISHRYVRERMSHVSREQSYSVDATRVAGRAASASSARARPCSTRRWSCSRSKSFDSLSLREVAREAGVVPTAFYRHFASMEELGLALVEESFRTLRAMIRAARADPRTSEHVIRSSVEILVAPRARAPAALPLHRPRALRRRRRAAPRDPQRDPAVRERARHRPRPVPLPQRWSTEDLQMLAGLIVNAMVSTAEEILDAPSRAPRPRPRSSGRPRSSCG